MKFSDLTRSDKGKLAVVCAALAVMLALGVALVSCSTDVSAGGIGASRAVADAADGAVRGIDEPEAVEACEAEDIPVAQQAEAVESAGDETVSHEGDDAVDAAAAASGQSASSPSRSEPKSEDRANVPAPAQSTPQRKWVEETEQVWVVDKAAWTESVPVYSTVEVSICNICGQDVTGNTSAHAKAHMKAGEGSGHHSEVRREVTGYETVSHAEEGHWETKVVGGHWE
ncbi:hypothetical protein [Eggerthella lenta]|uniref:hypothetical protein n=1 Tax=Eggerthella lenta TaxID=84112 RepID=UPI000DF8423C|nr:hypothetical protein [Eggerthella lenta]RDB97785.1 hypothetical protein C1867_04570 [Eggerthella lenta]